MSSEANPDGEEPTRPSRKGTNSSHQLVHESQLTLRQVFIVTGATSGVGAELAQILYAHNATVYIAARSKEKATFTMKKIKTAETTANSTGKLAFLPVDLSDLTTIRQAANDFLALESRLDVLWLNAGVSLNLI